MISKATVHNATVLMNRRMNTERRVTTFGPVCSSVAGMALHHLEGSRSAQERAHPLATNTRSSRELLSGHPSSNVAECNFDCRIVRVYRGGPGAWPDFC